MRWEWHWSTGDVGMSTAYRFSFCNEVVAGLITCGRLVLDQGAKVLSGSVQGIYPPHRGSWRCRASGTAGWSKRRRRRWSEGRSRRDQKQRSQWAKKMKMTMGWTETQPWATRASVRAFKQGRQSRRIVNAWWLMHWHQLHSHISKVFQITSQCCVFHSALRVTNSIGVVVPINSISDLYAYSL